MLGEPKEWQAQRQARMAMRYPELGVSDATGILNVDGERVKRGELPTTFSQTMMRLAAHTTRMKQ